MEFLANNKELAENKLILLYFIDKINKPVSNLQLTKVFLEKKFMNYFLLQHFLDELCRDSNLTSELIDKKTFYTITNSGKRTLDYLLYLVPSGIKSQIDNSASTIKKNMRNETQITADYIPESENEYTVTCKVYEDSFSLIDLKVTVGSKNDAKSICENWNKHAQLIYSEIMQSLIKKRGI